MKTLIDITTALWASLKPRSNQFEIDIYGLNTCELSTDELQALMSWLVRQLTHTGYTGKSYLLFDRGDEDWNRLILTSIFREEPLFLYRLCQRPDPPHCGSHWFLTQHPSLKLYQLKTECS
ncbi:hypothetical protein [Lyngbya sp. CCY1209]|jgi:hypothetical protein|uniref:hypothetical protein n=1 Tax=Lyngbya sp. CCY1209 TaxID=2886103 RepID=UPI002D205763|nr:hypothetical protein [Lyngbya sp. CCY1209]MEB3884431.1 hypothetical protein [Lyngbya sp. CCY1209]